LTRAFGRLFVRSVFRPFGQSVVRASFRSLARSLTRLLVRSFAPHSFVRSFVRLLVYPSSVGGHQLHEWTLILI
jgi:hypothetical protein